MNIREATASYEAWMRNCCPRVIDSDLRFKHRQMREDPFLFFRATYYRWAQLWPETCPELLNAPRVLAVSDLHVGSFGTWRDAEGRLCWGVDDFDEASPLPYTNDLVRLAASVKIVAGQGLLAVSLKAACESILDGYVTALKAGGCPFVLAERAQYLEHLGLKAIKPPSGFWKKLNHLPAVHDAPKDAIEALKKTLPDPAPACKIVRRRAGVGSLGQERFVALAQWDGAWIAREMKALMPPASLWLNPRGQQTRSFYREAIDSAVRSHDPFQTVAGKWIVRRLSPDSNPIEIEDLPEERDEKKLLYAMGAEAANTHLGAKRKGAVILKDLQKREGGWLRSAARSMTKSMMAEWKKYAPAK